MFNRKHIYLFLIFLPLLGYARPKGKIYSYTDAGLFSKEWKEVVRENPIDKDENIKVRVGCAHQKYAAKNRWA